MSPFRTGELKMRYVINVCLSRDLLVVIHILLTVCLSMMALEAQVLQNVIVMKNIQKYANFLV